MSTFEFLVKLKSQGIDVSMNGERLKLNAPKGTLTADIKAELTERKAEIIQFLKSAEEIGSAAEVVQIERIERTEMLPLSPAQERIYALYRLDPESTTLNMPVTLKLYGHLNIRALNDALTQLVERHETLRTLYPVESGQPYADVMPARPHMLRIVRLEELPQPEREALRLIEEEAEKRPFRLHKLPPFRTTLYTLSPSESILLLHFHQINYDWGAFNTLFDDLAALYLANTHETEPDLDELPFQYVDFAAWQQERLTGERLESLETYWQEQTANDYHLLHLPTELQPEPPEDNRHEFVLDRQTTSALKALSQQNGTTLFVTLLAIYKLMLTTYAPKDDVAVFTTAGGDRTELKKLIGLFANLTLLKTDLAPASTVGDLLASVKASTMGAIAHQELPIEQILHMLQWHTAPHHNNIFQTAFIYENSEPGDMRLADLDAELLDESDHLAGFDWRFLLTEESGKIFGALEYDNGRYPPDTVAEFVADWETAVSRLIDNPDLPLDLLRPDKSLLAEEPATDAPSPHTPPRDALEKSLVTLWQATLKQDNISIDDNFFDLGGHSLLAAELFHQIKVETDANLPLALLIDAPTVRQIADYIRAGKGDQPWQSLVPIQTAGTQPPLFLIHGAGGNVLLYRDLAKQLGSDQPVYGLQAQGLDGKGNYLTDFETMAARYIEEIRAVQPEGPYHLGGYCLGGTLSYEIAQQLQAQGESVGLVAMFESFNVHFEPELLTGKYALIHKLQNLWFHAENLLRLPLKDMVAFFREKAAVEVERFKARWANRTQKQDDDLIHEMIDHVNDAAQEAYLPQPLQSRIAIFRPRKDFVGMDDPMYGWGDLASGDVTVHQLNVNPKGMMVEPYVQDLAAEIQDILKKK